MANDTINPYKMAYGLAIRKFYYDLQMFGSSNNHYLKSIKNKYQGKKCVILCNGPSLNNTDFAQLQESGIFTIGLNKINLLFQKHSFKPNLIVSVNALVVEQNSDFYLNTEIPLLLDFWACRKANITKKILTKGNSGVLYSSDSVGKFAKDISSGINQGSTVTFAALQIAFHMGFDSVALIGCDHSFAVKGTPNKTVTQKGADESHFDPNYFGNGVQWQLPDLIGSEFHYQIADEAFREENKKIYNCTQGGKLEIFERISISDFYKL